MSLRERENLSSRVAVSVVNGTGKPVNILPAGPIVTPGKEGRFEHPLTLPLFFSVHNGNAPYPFRLGGDVRYALKHRRLEGVEEWGVKFDNSPEETVLLSPGVGSPMVSVVIGDN